MSAFASRAYHQVPPSVTGQTGSTRRLSATLSLPVVVALFVAITVLTTLSAWGGSSVVGGIYSVLTATISTNSVVVAGAVSGGHIPAAIRAVEAEKENVETEQETFREFAEEVQSLSPAVRSVMGTNAQTVNTGSTSRVLEQVRDTYRETVMSTPDFDNEYGETFHEHVATEFGDDVASLLTSGHQLNEPVKRLIVQQAKQSAQHREQLLEGLKVEERSLRRAATVHEVIQETLNDIESTDLTETSLSTLVDLDAELRTRRADCLHLLRTRQEEIHTVNRRLNGQSKTLTQEYLYGELAVLFPVLSSTLAYLDAIEDARSEVIEAVCRTR